MLQELKKQSLGKSAAAFAKRAGWHWGPRYGSFPHFLTLLLIQVVAIALLFISLIASTILIAPIAWAAELSCPEDMLYVPGDIFKIGSDAQHYIEERSADDVKVSSFCIDKHETTKR
ncbi:MAG: hypothetical protein JO235_28995 [Chroococcidiopsidaceae cyanobacterium CP_BM_RX_35]|nr:hypothetical protein [Chroococcidiopsidaceae cyanobacterium CP_BM_RX_35]